MSTTFGWPLHSSASSNSRAMYLSFRKEKNKQKKDLLCCRNANWMKNEVLKKCGCFLQSTVFYGLCRASWERHELDSTAKQEYYKPYVNQLVIMHLKYPVTVAQIIVTIVAWHREGLCCLSWERRALQQTVQQTGNSTTNPKWDNYWDHT